jgi:hypothetical protein
MPLNARWRFTHAALQYAPEEPGVFTLWDRGELIYIGSARRPATLREALLGHLAGANPCTRTATHYGWQIDCLDPEAAERRFVSSLCDDGRALPRCNRRPAR